MGGLPLLVWALWISLVSRKATFTVEILKLLSSMTVINTLLAWIILPILFMFGNAPSDDVTNFLRYTEMPPLLLVLTASILYAGGWILFLSKIENLRTEFLLFTANDPAVISVGTRRTIPLLTGLLALCVIVAFGLHVLAEKNPLNALTPPQGFSPIAQLDLSKQVYSSAILTRFSLQESTDIEIFIAVSRIDTPYFDLSVTGPDGFKSVVLHGEQYRADVDGGLWRENLPAGTYQVVLRSHRSPGTASIFMKIH